MTPRTEETKQNGHNNIIIIVKIVCYSLQTAHMQFLGMQPESLTYKKIFDQGKNCEREKFQECRK